MHERDLEKRTDGVQLSLMVMKGAASKDFAYPFEVSRRKGEELLG